MTVDDETRVGRKREFTQDFARGVFIVQEGIISILVLLVRRFVGDDYRYLIPCSAAAGALVLLVADTFGRLIIAPVILPVGAITSFLGGPAFLFLLVKGGGRK